MSRRPPVVYARPTLVCHACRKRILRHDEIRMVERELYHVACAPRAGA